MKGQTLLKMKNANNETYYIDSKTGEEVTLQRKTGKFSNFIPRSVYGRFRVPYSEQILSKIRNR